MKTDLVTRTKEFIREERMFSPGDTVLCGVSGGADSLCLLSVLRELSGELSLTLRAIHVEHGIRGEESLEDAAFVEALCGDWEVPLSVVNVDAPGYAASHGVSLEEAARELRYEAFQSAGRDMEEKGREAEASEHRGTVRIAVAHHADDNAETILFQMIRGTGYRGACGMLPVRENICRPLLFVSREEIEDYLRERDISWRTDSTNASMEHSRNRIRYEVMPVLKEINPKAVLHLCRSAEILRRLSEEHGKTLASLLKQYMDDEGGLLRKPVSQLPPEEQREILHAWFRQISPSQRDIGTVHIEAVRGLLTGPSRRSVDLPHRTTVCSEKQRLLFREQKEDKIYKKLHSVEKLC